MKHHTPTFEHLSPEARALLGDDGPPTNENAAPAGNRDGAYEEYAKGEKIYSGKRKEIQARIDALLGFSTHSDSPLDVVMKMTEFPDISGSRAKPLPLSMRDFYDELPHREGRTKEALPLIVGGEFGKERSPEGSLRHAANRKNVTVVVLDYDAERIPFAETERRVEEAGVAAVGFTTPSHTEDAPRHRWLFPLSRPHSPDEIIELTERANSFLDGTAASESGRIDQSFYFGQVTGRPPMTRALIDGDFLDERNDIEPMPLIGKRSKRHADKAEDPTKKRGVVGAWCRSHDVVDVIKNHLPGVYEKRGKRYRLKAGSSKTAGVVIYDDGRFAYSNHGSDPCGGRLVNSFDLPRIHLYGHLDEGLAPDTPMTDRPSYRAMCLHARRDPAVAAELAREESDLIDEFDDVSEPGKPSGLTFLTPSECEAAPSRGYVIKKLIAPCDVGCIFGAPGAGKSLIAPYLGFRVAQGEEAFGMRTKAGGVFYVAAEDETGMRGRVAALKDELGDAEDFVLVGGVSSLFVGSAHHKALMRAIEERKPSLIFIDTLAMAFPGLEENSAESMGKVVAVARGLTAHGAAVVLIHHSTKDSNGTPRGHSILNGALDFAVELQAKDDSGIIRGRLTKNRNGPCDLDIAFKIAVTPMGEDEDCDPITYARCRPLDGPVPKAGPKPTPAEKAALDVLKGLDRGEGVDERDWRRACQRDRILCASDDPESRRKAAYRAIQGLARKRLVGLHNGRAWPWSPAYEFGQAVDIG